MKKITPFMFLFFTGFVISIASITSYKQNPKLICRIPEKVRLSVKDLVNLDILNINHHKVKLIFHHKIIIIYIHDYL